jgi:hypothetical protein
MTLSTQVPPQSIDPVGQPATQPPLSQWVGPVQTIPQPPQLLLELRIPVQFPPQQAAPVPQVIKHCPQLFWSDAKSVQVPQHPGFDPVQTTPQPLQFAMDA